MGKTEMPELRQAGARQRTMLSPLRPLHPHLLQGARGGDGRPVGRGGRRDRRSRTSRAGRGVRQRLADLPYQRRGAPVPAGEARSGPCAGKAEPAGSRCRGMPVLRAAGAEGMGRVSLVRQLAGAGGLDRSRTPEMNEDEAADSIDDGIFDPELLEQAEEYVKLLPDGLFPGGVRQRMPVAGRSASRGRTRPRVRRAADERDDQVDAEEDEEPEPVGSECPACGRQAQKGWTRCPWCGAALGSRLCRGSRPRVLESLEEVLDMFDALTHRQARHPGDRGELGRLSRRGDVGPLRHRLARRRLDDGHLVPGPLPRLHRHQQEVVRGRRQHPAPAGRLDLRHRRRPRHLPDQDDHPAAGRHRRDAGGRHLLGPLLRFLRKTGRPLGHRPPPTHLRKGPPGPGGSRPPTLFARPGASREVPRGLPASGLPAGQGGLRREGGSARSARARPWRSCTPRARPGWRARRRPASRCEGRPSSAGSRSGSRSREAGAARRWPSPGTTVGLLVGDRQAAVAAGARRAGADRGRAGGGRRRRLRHRPDASPVAVLASDVRASSRGRASVWCGSWSAAAST